MADPGIEPDESSGLPRCVAMCPSWDDVCPAYSVGRCVHLSPGALSIAGTLCQPRIRFLVKLHREVATRLDAAALAIVEPNE